MFHFPDPALLRLRQEHSARDCALRAHRRTALAIRVEGRRAVRARRLSQIVNFFRTLSTRAPFRRGTAGRTS